MSQKLNSKPMKKLFISAGLVAVGAAGVQSALADATPQIWTASATLRGFYDDNYASSNTKKGSFGVEVSPSVSANINLQQTDFGARYIYGLYWYQKRQIQHQDPFDQSHEVDLWMDHAFDERWKMNVSDTFAIGQDPELLTPGAGNASAAPFRVSGNNLANHFNLALDTQWTRQFSTELTYDNNFYYYQQKGANVTTNILGDVTAVQASNAGLLNRIEQTAGLALQWQFQPETTGFIGYNFTWFDYIQNEKIGVIPAGPNPNAGKVYYSDSRNLYQNQLYIGVKHNFTANLSGTVKVGANYNDSYNDEVDSGSKTSWSPYANLALTYTYLPGSYAQVGFTHNINATDISTVGGDLTQYEESSVIYGSINHHFTDKLLVSLIGQVVYSDYIGGGTSSLGTDVDYSTGISLTYQFNRYFSADVGYNFDDLQSDIAGRSYSRNYCYLGVTATY